MSQQNGLLGGPTIKMKKIIASEKKKKKFQSHCGDEFVFGTFFLKKATHLYFKTLPVTLATFISHILMPG